MNFATRYGICIINAALRAAMKRHEVYRQSDRNDSVTTSGKKQGGQAVQKKGSQFRGSRRYGRVGILELFRYSNYPSSISREGVRFFPVNFSSVTIL